MESELPNFSLNLDFGNFENETPNKRVKKCQKRSLIKVLKIRKVSIEADKKHLHCVPGKNGLNRASNAKFWAESGYGVNT